MHFLCPSWRVRDPKCEQFTIPPISFASTTITRVCRATLQAEVCSLQSGVESGDRIRGELYGCVTLGVGVMWHDQTRRKIPHLLLTDCRSLHDHLNADVPAKVSDKKFQIELNAMMQSLLEDSGAVRSTDVFLEGGDPFRWIETSTMIADALTKSTKPVSSQTGNTTFTLLSSATSSDCAKAPCCTAGETGFCTYSAVIP